MVVNERVRTDRYNLNLNDFSPRAGRTAQRFCISHQLARPSFQILHVAAQFSISTLRPSTCPRNLSGEPDFRNDGPYLVHGQD